MLVIGAGIAGLAGGPGSPAELDVLVVTKDSIQQSNSTYAQGGIAGVLSPEDRFENHIEDTLTAGGRAVRSRHRRDGGPRGAGPDQRPDPLGHALRPRKTASSP